jgi:hypothetical protein
VLDRHRTEIDAWLEADPTMTAVDVLTRLKALHPTASPTVICAPPSGR